MVHNLHVMANERDAKARHGRAANGRGQSLYQQAFEIIAGQIAQGALLAGERLTETQIAERFGVSRAPARQALAQLEQAGMVSKADGRGFVVRDDFERDVSSNDQRMPPAEPAQLRASPSWERIYDEIEGEIAQRAIVSAWRVTEADLARHYDVSRTVARDVLGRLQQAGVVSKDDRSHWFAPALTTEYVGELYELRAILEPEALARSAESVPPAFLAQMRSNLEAAMRMGPKVDWTMLDQLEDEMHVQLLSYCGSRAMLQAIRLHQSLLIAHRFLYRTTAAMFVTEPFLAEHLSIIEKMQADTIGSAKETLRTHLLGSGHRAMSRIEHLAGTYDPPELPYLKRIKADRQPNRQQS